MSAAVPDPTPKTATDDQPPKVTARYRASRPPDEIGQSPGCWSQVAFSNVQRWRKHRGLTVDQLAASVRRLGIPMSRRIFYDIASDSSERRLDLDELIAFAIALEVSPTKLLVPQIGDRPVAPATRPSATRIPAETLAWWIVDPDRKPPIPPTPNRDIARTFAPPAPRPDDPDVKSLLRDVSVAADYIASRTNEDLDRAFQFAHNSNVALFTLTRGGIIETCNHAAEVLAGRTAAELIGHLAADFLTGPLDPGRTSLATPSRLLGLDGDTGGGYVGSASIDNPASGPTRIAVVVKPEHDAEGNIAGFSCAAHRIATRVTPTKDAHALPAGATDAGEVCSHLDGTIYLFSPRAEAICHVKAATARGHTWTQIGLDPHLDTRWYTYVHNLFSYGHATWTQPFHRPDGTTVRLLFRGRLLYGAGADPDGILTLIYEPKHGRRRPRRRHTSP